jgi:hypothetical protein
VDHCHAADGIVLLDHVHQAHIGQAGHGQAREALEGRFIIERGIEQRAGLGEERRAALRSLGLDAGRLLAGQQLGALGLARRDRLAHLGEGLD